MIVFAVWWSTSIEKMSQVNSRDIEQVRSTYSQFDAKTTDHLYKLSDRLNDIDRKLSKIEGLLESMQYSRQPKTEKQKK